MATLAEILEFLGNDLISIPAEVPDLNIGSIQPADLAEKTSLVFAWEKKYLQEALDCAAQVLVTNLDVKDSEKLILKSPNPHLAMTFCLNKFFPNQWIADEEPNIHPSAVVAVDATIGKNVHIGANTVIHPGVTLGDDCILRENCVVESGSTLGEGTHLFPMVMIGRNSTLGKNCTIQSFTIIGSEGFGYAPDQKNVRHPIPHKGRVILGDRVDVGASTTIDRGTFGETVIGNDTKIDNQSHLGHNFKIGERGVLAGGFLSAGSTEIGNDFIAGGHCCLSGHIKITDGVIFAASTVVRSDVKKPGIYGGEPPHPINEYRRNFVVNTKLAEMKKNVSKLMREVFKDQKT